MTRTWVRLAASLALGLSLAGAADGARVLAWSDLVPRLEKFDDPFVSLTTEQKMDLSVVAVVRQMQARGESPQPRQVETVNAAQARLGKAGVKIDELLARRAEITEKRRKAAESVNESLDGKRVRMPGYVLPLEVDGRKVTEFLLVPYVGACIHEPVPPPNQIVHVKNAQGFEAAGLFTSVWVEGVIRTGRKESMLRLVDGAAAVPTGYSLAADKVESYRK